PPAPARDPNLLVHAPPRVRSTPPRTLGLSRRSPTGGSRGHSNALIQPLLEADLAESRVAGRNQRALAEFGPEVPRVRVNDNLAGIVARTEALADQFIETELLGAGHF